MDRPEINQINHAAFAIITAVTSKPKLYGKINIADALRLNNADISVTEKAVIGNGNKILARRCIVVGDNNKVTGTDTLVFGKNCRVDGTRCEYKNTDVTKSTSVTGERMFGSPATTQISIGSNYRLIVSSSSSSSAVTARRNKRSAEKDDTKSTVKRIKTKKSDKE